MKSTLDWKCRHLRQGSTPPGRHLPEQSCAVGVDLSAVRPIVRPCIQNPARPSAVVCPKRESMTEEEKAAEMAPFIECIRALDAGLSPCCREPIVQRQTARSVWVYCSKCGGLCSHTLVSLPDGR